VELRCTGVYLGLLSYRFNIDADVLAVFTKLLGRTPNPLVNFPRQATFTFELAVKKCPNLDINASDTKDKVLIAWAEFSGWNQLSMLKVKTCTCEQDLPPVFDAERRSWT